MSRVLAIIVSVFWLAAVASPANAFVLNWDYTLDYGFTSWVVDEGSSGAQPITTSDPVTLAGESGFRQLTWGDPANQPNRSSIWFEQKTGVAQTNGPLVDVINMFHANYPIWSTSDQLESGVVRSVLTLTPQGTSDTGSFTTTFDFYFWETTNDGTYEDDIFIVASIADSEFGFDYAGDHYDVSFLPSFDTIDPAALADNGISWPGTAYGWTTQENLTNEEHTRFLVTTPVPEPATFAIFGLGLLSLLGLRRKFGK